MSRTYSVHVQGTFVTADNPEEACAQVEGCEIAHIAELSDFRVVEAEAL